PVFDIESHGGLTGNAKYANNPLFTAPRIEANANLKVRHGEKATLIIRQPVLRQMADLMVAQHSGGIPLKFDGVGVLFQRLGILDQETFTWYGIPEIRMDEARR